MSGNEKGQKCCLRAPTGSAGQRKGAKVSPEGSDARCPATKKGKIVPEGSDERCWATKKGKIVAWGLRCEVSGDEKGQNCCRRAPARGVGRRKRAKLSPEGSDERCRATKKGKSVAGGLRCEVSGDEKGQNCRRRVPMRGVWRR